MDGAKPAEVNAKERNEKNFGCMIQDVLGTRQDDFQKRVKPDDQVLAPVHDKDIRGVPTEEQHARQRQQIRPDQSPDRKVKEASSSSARFLVRLRH